MPTVMGGDFSDFPEELRDVMPYLQGEVCELRGNREIYTHLFMSDAARTELFDRYLKGILGAYQNFLQDDMFATISRLTDRDSQKQKNLTLWSLVERCEKWRPSVAIEIRKAIEALVLNLADIREHRNKRLAHFDLPVSLGSSPLPVVTFTELFSAIEKLEAILNIISLRASNTTIMFDLLDHRDMTAATEITVYKAAAYDDAVQAGLVEPMAWRRHVPKVKRPLR